MLYREVLLLDKKRKGCLQARCFILTYLESLGAVILQKEKTGINLYDVEHLFQIFEKYMEDVFKKQDIHAVVNCGSISIDSKDLISHPFVREKIPNLFEEISQKPEKIISCLGKYIQVYDAVVN